MRLSASLCVYVFLSVHLTIRLCLSLYLSLRIGVSLSVLLLFYLPISVICLSSCLSAYRCVSIVMGSADSISFIPSLQDKPSGHLLGDQTINLGERAKDGEEICARRGWKEVKCRKEVLEQKEYDVEERRGKFSEEEENKEEEVNGAKRKRIEWLEEQGGGRSRTERTKDRKWRKNKVGRRKWWRKWQTRN